MKRVLLCVFDLQAQVFGQPLFVPTEGVGLRMIGDEVNRADSALHAHPEDYRVYRLGFFEDSTGQFEGCPVLPELVVDVSALLRE